MMNILIFAGTYEGRKLCEALDTAADNLGSLTVYASTATEYGARGISALSHIHVYSSRMNTEQIRIFIEERSIELVIDATHPYAQEVTANITAAVRQNGVRYLRLLRDGGQAENVVPNIAAAVDYLQGTSGSVLVTTGSKELHLYTALADYAKRLYVRVLPTPEVLARCHELGFQADHIIAMQGPFSYDMNLAMLRAYDCHYLVTKNSGAAGGLEEKLSAAAEAGADVIFIDRPTKETGLSLNEVLAELGIAPNQALSEAARPIDVAHKEFFPLFVSSKGKKALVVGGGQIAERRVKTLLLFEYQVTVVAPEATDFIKESADICWLQAEFEPSQLEDFDIVTAATNQRLINQSVAQHARVPASIADSKEESTFYFPAVVIAGDLVAGLSSGGKNPATVRRIAAILRKEA